MAYMVDGEKVCPHYNCGGPGERAMKPTERLQLCWGCGNVFITSLPTNKCERCVPRTDKQVVTWVYRDDMVEWLAKRMPALGWNTLTLLEALADSAAHTIKTSPETATRRINEILRILRKNIEKEKARVGRGLLKRRCPFRETKRTRCNRFPVLADGYCKLHSKERQEGT